MNAIPLIAQEESEEGRKLKFGFEAKAHYRDSDFIDFPLAIRVPPEDVPGGVVNGNLSTVEEGTHFEVSALTFFLEARWGKHTQARIKVDAIDLHERNPTSSDNEVDIDEAWILFGRATRPATLPEDPGGYVKVGKFPKFERQNDRHLESYGLVSTAFNRLEDLGLEVGWDAGPHFYGKLSLTQGNPVFMRDPNALAGDNGTPEFVGTLTPQPEFGSGIVIPYDAEVEAFEDFDHLEVGGAIGARFGDLSGDRAGEVMLWGYRRDLAETTELEGTFYGGDLDLLQGPFNFNPFPISGDQKEEYGANLWLYLLDFSFFAQVVDQDLAGLGRTGIEGEAAWRFELPFGGTVGGHQLFPWIQPAIRYSRLEPDFAPPAGTPTPSFAWDWEKIDIGIRLGIVRGLDLTAEYSINDFIVRGQTRSNDELLTTLRWRWR